MAFPQGYVNTPGPLGSGEIYGGSHVILGTTNFANGLLIGRFCKIDATSQAINMDGIASPKIGGVVMRKASYPENPASGNPSAIDSGLYVKASYVTQGLVTVDAITGESPQRGDAVFAYNGATVGDRGKATLTAQIATTAKFVEAISADVWLVQLT